jgi:hypothetical protein
MPLRIISLKLVVRAARITRRRFYIALNIPAQREASQNRVTTGLGMPGIAPQYRFFHHRAPLCSAAQPFSASGVEFGNGGRFLLSRMRIRRAFFTSAVHRPYCRSRRTFQARRNPIGQGRMAAALGGNVEAVWIK